MLLSLLFLLLGIKVSAELREGCKNITVSETDVSLWLEKHAPTKAWDRPMKNSLDPIPVYVGLAMTSFAMIVSHFFIFLPV